MRCRDTRRCWSRVVVGFQRLHLEDHLHHECCPRHPQYHQTSGHLRLCSSVVHLVANFQCPQPFLTQSGHYHLHQLRANFLKCGSHLQHLYALTLRWLISGVLWISLLALRVVRTHPHRVLRYPILSSRCGFNSYYV